jgi:hypothetical protein
MPATRIVLVTILMSAVIACGDVNAALERLSEARQLSSDLQVQFTKAADAANRAVGRGRGARDPGLTGAAHRRPRRRGDDADGEANGDL